MRASRENLLEKSPAMELIWSVPVCIYNKQPEQNMLKASLDHMQ